jgi:hypothetical protein
MSKAKPVYKVNEYKGFLKTNARVRGMAEVVKCSSSKYKVLSSNPLPPKKKKTDSISKYH